MSEGKVKRRVPWYLWPFVAIWDLVIGVVVLTGRLVAAVLGLVLLLVGGLLTATVVGAIVGIPIAIFGFLLIVRSLW